MQKKPLDEIRLSAKHKLTEDMKVGDYLKLVIEDMIEKSGEERPIIFEWKDIVGPLLYEHIKIVSIKGNKLVLKADHPSFRSAFMLQEREILKKIQSKFPSSNIKSIQIY